MDYLVRKFHLLRQADEIGYALAPLFHYLNDENKPQLEKAMELLRKMKKSIMHDN